MASTSVQSHGKNQVSLDHREPEKPLVYEPPDLHGRKHVEKITTEYRVREDGCLADRLQNEEFELHFGKNKVDNKILHMDLKTAKSIYLREVEDSGVLSKDELAKLCKDDEFIAQEIEKRVNENKDLECQTKTATEMQDEEFAIYLQTKEKQKLEEERKERLKLHLRRDRVAAERLQRELNLQAEREEILVRGMSEVKVSSPRQKANRNVECEAGRNPDKHTKEAEISMKVAEQRRLEEERDRRIAIKLQREEAEEYQRAKREKQMRRAQTERRHDDHSAEQRRNVQAVDSNGRPIAITPPERRKNRYNSDQSDSPVSSKHRPGVVAGKVSSTGSPSKNIDNNKKNLQSVDATGRPVRDPSNIHTPRKYKENTECPPEEGIYLTAVDAIGAVQGSNSSSNVRPRTCSEPKRNMQKQSSLPLARTVSGDSQCRSGEERIQTNTEGQTIHRNIAADIDPTYSTINHFTPRDQNHVTKREGDIRPAPVVQNIKRPSLNEAEKKKKKWFSKKEKAR